METAGLPISIASWALALVPIIVPLVLLAVLRWKAPQAGPVGMFTAAAVSVLALQTPWDTLAVAGAKGVWDAITSSSPLCCCTW
jgi:lactate permease